LRYDLEISLGEEAATGKATKLKFRAAETMRRVQRQRVNRNNCGSLRKNMSGSGQVAFSARFFFLGCAHPQLSRERSDHQISVPLSGAGESEREKQLES